MSDSFFNLAELFEKQYQEDIKFIAANFHVMGIPWFSCSLTEKNTCFGFDVDHGNSSIIRNEIELSIKTKDPFCWTRLHQRLSDYEELKRHNNLVLKSMGWFKGIK